MRPTPILRRRVFEPLWAWRTGAPLLRAWAELEATQWMPEPVLRERQWRRLLDLITFAYEHNDFYHARLDACGLTPARLHTEKDLAEIPILSKEEIRSQGSRLISRGFDVRMLMKAKTGGSTGKPLELFFPEEVSQLRNASGRRHKRWSGWEVGEPVGAVWGNPPHATTPWKRLRQWMLSPIVYVDTMSITTQSVVQFARDWVAVRPTLLFGHAHSVYILATMVQDLGIDAIRPTGIITSSMMLLPHERALIEHVFDVKVCDTYGCEEVGLIASECERHEGLHVNTDQLWVEVLREDGSPAGPAERGLVVITDLLNRAMPLIRYRVEDLAETAERPCSCGRGLPMLRAVCGRVADFLKRRDGSRVAGVSLIENSLTKIPGIDQMQIVQEAIGEIRLRIVASHTFTPAHRQELIGYFEEVFPGARVEVEQLASIAPEPNGKYRFSICRIPD